MSIERLFALEKIPQEIVNEEVEYKTEEGRIEFKGVSLRYRP